MPGFAGIDFPADLGTVLDGVVEPGRFADAVAGTLGAELDHDIGDLGQQKILEAVEVGARLEALDELVRTYEAEAAKAGR